MNGNLIIDTNTDKGFGKIKELQLTTVQNGVFWL